MLRSLQFSTSSSLLGWRQGGTSHTRWTFKLKFALGCHNPNDPFPFVLMANIVIPPDHWGKRIMAHYKDLTPFSLVLALATMISSRAVLFFSSHRFPAYSKYSSWGSNSLCQVWNTSLCNRFYVFLSIFDLKHFQTFSTLKTPRNPAPAVFPNHSIFQSLFQLSMKS